MSVPVREVIDNRKYRHAAEDENIPVETGGIWVRRRREADHDYAQAKKEQGKKVDEVASDSQVPPWRPDGVGRETVRESAGDGYPVRRKNGDRREGRDDVECDDRSQRNEGETCYNNESEKDRIPWDMRRRGHLSC